MITFGKRFFIFFTAAVVASTFLPFSAAAAGLKIATLSIQRVVNECAAGKAAQKMLEGKMVELQVGLQKEQKNLDALKDEIEKKRSIWSDDVRDKKEREYQKIVRELKAKSDDARYELKQTENKMMRPILVELEKVIKTFGPRDGYTMIFDNTSGRSAANGLLYSDKSIDITEIAIKEVDRMMTEKAKDKKAE